MKTQIDHLVVVAPSREVGMQYLSERLGVTPELGGKHERMGTHNALLKLNRRMYIEVIAIDPDATAPQRARLFALDNTPVEPKLMTWVVRTNDISQASANVSLGRIEAMSRDSFNWLITIPPDGSLPMNGAVPTLIQWLGDLHPCDKLSDTECELLSLEIRHQDADMVKLALDRIGFENPLVQVSAVSPESSGLRARIKTPHGVCEL